MRKNFPDYICVEKPRNHFDSPGLTSFNVAFSSSHSLSSSLKSMSRSADCKAFFSMEHFPRSLVYFIAGKGDFPQINTVCLPLFPERERAKRKREIPRDP